MKKRVLLGVAVFIAGWVILFAVVTFAASRQLLEARAALSGVTQDLDVGAIENARSHLERAEATLDGLSGRVARLVPVLGSNLDAMAAVATSAQPVLDAAIALDGAARSLETEGVLSEGRVRFDVIDGLIPALERQLDSVEVLTRALEEHRKGGLLPPVWNALDSFLGRTRYLSDTASDLYRLLQLSDGLLGADGKRTYLVLLINNAELRGAGGLLSGVGTVVVNEGRISLGPLFTAEQLQTKPLRKVSAPADYERRYGLYKANTTLWKNATYSSDFPEVAVVAARLFEDVTGVRTDGALQVDPRALAALMPDDSAIEIPTSGDLVEREQLAEYVYSIAYERFPNPRRRRLAILEAGFGAFETILGEGLRDREMLSRAGAAVAGGHLRFTSFDPVEAAALDRVGASGNLAPVPSDSLLVAAQNFGGGRGEGSKLDHWTERTIRHGCNIEEPTSAVCATEVTFRNTAPDGLTRYVAGYPYGRLRSFVEIYIPESAEPTGVTQDGDPVEFRSETEDGREAVEVYIELAQDDATEIQVNYVLPLSNGHYSFVATPQPLTQDGPIEIVLSVPAAWVIRTPDGVGYERSWRHSSTFDRTIEVEAMPDPRTGLPAFWEGLTDFLDRPVF